MNRIGRRILIESARLGVAVAVGYLAAVGLESTCPPPTPENSSPGCEGPSYIYGALLGFAGTLVLTVVGERLWRRQRRKSAR
jgi:uncharacterized membrane protein